LGQGIGSVEALQSNLTRLPGESFPHYGRSVISAVQRNLDGASTAVEDLGLVEIKGQHHPARVFRVA